MAAYRSAKCGILIVCLSLFGVIAQDCIASASLQEAQLALRAKDYVEARRILKALAANNDAQAQYHLGALHRLGRGGPTSYLKAYTLYSAAAQQGHREAMYQLATLYEKGLGVVSDKEQAMHWLHRSASAGHRLAGLKQEAQSKSVRGEVLFTEAEAAIRGDNGDALITLIDQGLLALDDDRRHLSLCYTAIEYGREKILNVLLQGSCGSGSDSPPDDALVVSAVQLGYSGMLQSLLRHGANVNSINRNSDSVFHLAALRNDVEILALLMKYGVDRNVRDRLGRSALDAALDTNQNIAAHFLRKKNILQYIDRDAVSRTDAAGTVLFFAVQRGDSDNFEALVVGGADTEATQYSVSVLAFSLQQGQANIAEFLLQRGVSLHAPDGYLSLNHWVAEKSGNKSRLMLELLHRYGVGVEAFNLEAVYTALLKSQQFDAAESVLKAQRGAIKHKLKQQLLRNAATYGHSGLFALFPKLYSDVALRIAVEKNHSRFVDNLLKRDRPNVNQMSSAGLPMLCVAITHGNLMLVQRLLQRGARVDERSNASKTALMYAAEGGHKLIVATLLNAGADLSEVSESGKSALMYAAYSGHAELVEQLLLAGADRFRRNEHGKTAADLALAAGYRSLAARLQ